MKSHTNFAHGLGYCLLNAFLVFLMVFFLLPVAVPKVNAESDNVTTGSSSDNLTSRDSLSTNSTIPDIVSDNKTNEDIIASDNLTQKDGISDNSDNTSDNESMTDITLDTSLLSLNTSKITLKSDESANITSKSGKIRLDIPKDAIKNSIEVDLTEKYPSGSTGMKILNLFELNAFSVSKTEKDSNDNKQFISDNASESVVSEKIQHFQFEKELTLTIQNTAEELEGIDVDSLHLYYLDEETGQWVLVSDKFDKETLTLTATLTHFSYYGEQANPLQSGPGRVLASQVDLNSGSASYSYPIELPAGPGGFQPSLSLNYNSGSVDGMHNKRDVGSWVGIGWTLHFGRISYSPNTREYFLDLSGGSYKLVTTDGTNYKTQPDQYYKITRSSSNTWEVYDKDGNYYCFGGTTDSAQYNDGTCYYRWDLSSWKDTNNNTANVTYGRDIWNNSVRSAYPKFLRYNQNKVQVEFFTSFSENGTCGVVRADTPITYGSNPIPKNIENRQLDRIEIKINGSLNKKYSFTYNTTNRALLQDYGGIYYSGRHTLTAVTQYGANGSSALPITSFTYENLWVLRTTNETQYTGNPGNPAYLSLPFLTIVNSGYGGNVAFTYTRIPDPTVNNIWTREAVTTKTINSGIGVSETHNYTYTGNPQYSGTGWDQEFRGWNEVIETDAANNYIKHYFYTLGTQNGQSADDFIGKEYNTKWYQHGTPDKLVKEKNYTWTKANTFSQSEGTYLGAKSGGTLSNAYGIAVAPDGYVYVASYSTNRIVKYDKNLQYVSSPWDNINISPSLIAIDAQYYIYVLCNDGYVRKYTNSGTQLMQFFPSGAGQIGSSAIAVGANGDIFLTGRASSGLYGVFRYNSSGTFLNAASPGGYIYDYVYRLYIPADGFVYVTVGRAGQSPIPPFGKVYYRQVLKFDSSLSGYSFAYIGNYDSWPTSFNVAVSENSSVYVTNPTNNTILNVTNNTQWNVSSTPRDFVIGEAYFYLLTNNDDLFRYTKGYNNWVVQLTQVDEIDYNTTSGSKVTRTGYHYDNYGNVDIQSLYGDNSTSTDDSAIHKSYYYNTTNPYYIVSKPSREWVTDASNTTVKDTRYYYDNNNSDNTTQPTKGNLTRTEQINNVAPYSVSSYNHYEPTYGNLDQTTDARGYTTNYTYETSLNTYTASKSIMLVGPENCFYNWNWSDGSSNGVVRISVIDANSNNTTSYYDTFNRIWKVVKPGDTFASPSIEYIYTAWGTLNSQCITTKTKITPTTYLYQTQYFDGLGRVVQVQSNGETGHTIIASTTTFNNCGQVDKQYVGQDIASVLTTYQTPDAGWKYSSSTYDGLGRVISQTGADATTVTHNYTTAWQDTLSSPGLTPGTPHQKKYYYDAFQHLVKVDELLDNGSLSANTTYAYDTLGNLVDVWDAMNNHTHMTYDMLSHKLSMSDPDMGSWQYSYDNNGNLKTQIDAKSQNVTTDYDPLGRLCHKYYLGSTVANVTYGYDSTSGGNYGKGQRTSMIDASGNTNYKYNNLGQLIEETKIIPGSGAYTTSVTKYGYDNAGRNIWILYPTGENVTQTYNGRGLPYSLSGNVTGNLVTGSLYNSLGAMTEINLGNQVRTTYGYYGTGGAYDTTGGYYGRLWEIKTQKLGLGDNYLITSTGGGTISVPGEGSYGHYQTGAKILIVATPDPGYVFVCWTGNTTTIQNIYAATTNITMNGHYNIGAMFTPIAQVQDTQYTWDPAGNMHTRVDAVTTATENFSYDFLDRLSAVSGNYTESYSYNVIGNILSKDGLSYTYGDTAHVHAVTSVGANGYTYDLNGNIISRAGQTLTWDAENRLTSVSINGTVIATYVYDGNGNRVKKTEGGQTVLYINQYYEVNLTTTNATSSYYLGGKLIAQKEAAPSQNGTLRYVHQDSLSSTSLMTDNAGNQIGTTVKYLPFGACLQSPGLPTDKLFTGQRLDGTGLYYYNARYYDPTIGRFISPDTEGVDYNNPQSLNRYTYCSNSPLTNIDPTGHWSWKTFWTVTAIVVAVAVVVAVAIVAAPVVAAAATSVMAAADMAIVKAQVYTTSALTTVAEKLIPAASKGAGSGMLAEEAGLNITQQGLSTVQNHLAQFGDCPENNVMLDNLGNALSNGQNLAGANLNFYTHELTEAASMAEGVCQPVAHAFSMITNGVSPFSLYTPGALMANPEVFSDYYFMYWGLK